MLYYKPKIEKHDYFTGWTTIPGELLTEKERERRFRYLPDKIFEKVYVSKKRTYKMFGARFECTYYGNEIIIKETVVNIL